MGVGKLVVTGVKQGIKYSPVIATVIRQVQGPATDYAKTRLEAARHRRLAVTKASSVRGGTLLEVLHREQPVWVVYSGDTPVSAHPDLGVPIADLVAHADLDRRRPPEDFPSAKERADSARRRATSRVHLPRRSHGEAPDTEPDPPDQPVPPQDATPQDATPQDRV